MLELEHGIVTFFDDRDGKKFGFLEVLDEDGQMVRPLATELGFWRVFDPQPDGTNVELLLAHPTGIVEMYAGKAANAKVELRTDGVLVSTPTGSSGYCLSVGGPVVSPELDCLIMAPICPFLTIMPPMIFTGDKQIEIVVSYMPTNSEAYLTCDGQEGLALETGDRVIIGAAARKVLLAHLPETSFYSQLKDRGIL